MLAQLHFVVSQGSILGLILSNIYVLDLCDDPDDSRFGKRHVGGSEAEISVKYISWIMIEMLLSDSTV